MTKWITKKDNGKTRHVPIDDSKGHAQTLKGKLERLSWVKDKGFAFSDAGDDEATVYNTYYKGYYVEVFPLKLVRKGLKGWEYQIINNEKGIEYFSPAESGGNHPARTSKEARKYAISTLRTYLEEEGEN